MDQWHPNFKANNFLPRSAESSFNFLFNYNFEPFPIAGMEGKAQEADMMMRERSGECEVGEDRDAKKKRLTSEQLESLENSFQEEIKLDPERKMKLSRDLGLQPRQVAVWFQNRRARWKAKQLERLYESLKIDFEAVSRDKLNLQNEVMKLRAMLMEQATRNHKQVSTDISAGDETVESTSPASPVQSIAECHYLFGVHDYNNNNTLASPPPTSFWPPLPNSYPC